MNCEVVVAYTGVCVCVGGGSSSHRTRVSGIYGPALPTLAFLSLVSCRRGALFFLK